jgi:hypothetical protein
MSFFLKLILLLEGITLIACTVAGGLVKDPLTQRVWARAWDSAFANSSRVKLGQAALGAAWL